MLKMELNLKPFLTQKSIKSKKHKKTIKQNKYKEKEQQ